MHSKKNGNTTLTHCILTHGTARKGCRAITLTRHQEDNESKAISSLCSTKMIAKLERTLKMHNKRTKEQTKHTTVGATINNVSTTT